MTAGVDAGASSSPLSLHGATAVVTGASKGIGLAIARALASAGACVALVARDRALLEQHARELGGGAIAVPCDVSSADAVAQVMAELRARFGGAPRILVNNAGAFPLAPLEQVAVDTFARAIDINLVAPFLFVQAVLGDMKARGEGHIVSIGSVADRQVFPENGAYAPSKYGLRALHEVLRLETRGTGVRATLISPSAVDTPLWDPIGPDEREGFTPRAAMLAASDVADAVLYALTRPATVTIDELRLSRS